MCTAVLYACERQKLNFNTTCWDLSNQRTSWPLPSEMLIQSEDPGAWWANPGQGDICHYLLEICEVSNPVLHYVPSDLSVATLITMNSAHLWFCTSEGSAHPRFLHIRGLCTSEDSAHPRTLHIRGLYTSKDSAHPRTLHSQRFCKSWDTSHPWILHDKLLNLMRMSQTPQNVDGEEM